MESNKSSDEKKNKRPSEMPNKESKKKCGLNFWKTDVLTPPTTPETPNKTKSGYNMWKDEKKKENVKICELKSGFCAESIIFRVSLKSLKKDTKAGEMFHFHAFDGLEIQITAFPNETQKFYESVMMNRTYSLKNFQVKLESKEFPSGSGNDHYICLTSKSELIPIENNDVPPLKFDFTKIDAMESLDVNTKCDVIAIMGETIKEVTTLNGKLKREICLTDDTKECIKLTLWGNGFDYVDSSTQTPIIIRNAILGEYEDEKLLKCGQGTSIWYNPDIEVAVELKKWFDEEFKKIKK